MVNAVLISSRKKIDCGPRNNNDNNSGGSVNEWVLHDLQVAVDCPPSVAGKEVSTGTYFSFFGREPVLPLCAFRMDSPRGFTVSTGPV